MPTRFASRTARRALMRGLVQQGLPSFRAVLWGKCPNHCWYCGRSITIDSGTIDHLVPVAQGGQTVESNCILACKPCNNAKGAHSLAWYRQACAVERFYGEGKR